MSVIVFDVCVLHHRGCCLSSVMSDVVFSCHVQGKQIIVFDTQSGCDGSFVPSKVIEARHIRWTITDTDLSPDRRRVQGPDHARVRSFSCALIHS